MLDGRGLVAAMGIVVLTILPSCDGHGVGPSVIVDQVQAAAVQVSPSTATLDVGDTVRLSANVLDSAGNELLDRAVGWASNDTSVATVDGAGLVTARASGTVEIAATSGEARGTAFITVNGATGAALGLLRVSSSNPRYFSDEDGTPVLLTGSHTWSNLQDNGGSDPPPVFDYAAYLDTLSAHNHNFFRLWAWETGRWSVQTPDDNYRFNPTAPYRRTGPGAAEDGRPRYDLSQFDETYFARLRSRVMAAGQRGIYVSIMLFNGWSTVKDKGGFSANNPWRAHPFKAANNVNGVNGDLNGDDSGEETHELANVQVTAFQEAYVRRVIDTVNDLDNVLFEISNESHSDSQQWQYHVINLIKGYEATKPKQHPVGMTVEWPGGSNVDLFDSPADWISPNGSLSDPAVATGGKVILLDTDHLCGICGDRAWAWKSFLRGNNPIFMDPWDGLGYGVGGAGQEYDDPRWVGLRDNLGYVRQFASRVDLDSMVPRGDLASSGYCLARASGGDAAFLVYLPGGGTVTVDLGAATGTLSVEWFDPASGASVGGGTTTGGAQRSFAAPFAGEAVLYLY